MVTNPKWIENTRPSYLVLILFLFLFFLGLINYVQSDFIALSNCSWLGKQLVCRDLTPEEQYLVQPSASGLVMMILTSLVIVPILIYLAIDYKMGFHRQRQQRQKDIDDKTDFIDNTTEEMKQIYEEFGNIIYISRGLDYFCPKCGKTRPQKSIERICFGCHMEILHKSIEIHKKKLKELDDNEEYLKEFEEYKKRKNIKPKNS